MDVTLTDVDDCKNAVDDAGSDFSDFAIDAEDLELIDALLEEVASKQEEGPSLAVTDIEDYEAPRGLHLPKHLSQEQTSEWKTGGAVAVVHRGTILHDTEWENTEARKIVDEGATLKRATQKPSQEPPPPPADDDDRSPLERFRRPPKKALSVTDLVSPAWCELQYHYTLSKHGRKRRTPAMKQGTAVHQDLENEMHTTVPVEITKKEDSWGLRIWNIIQGLRTLREVGCTREFEVWGTVGGEIVNGVIDELSYTCPDEALEEQHERLRKGANQSPVLPENQRSITDYLLSGAKKEAGYSIEDAMQGVQSTDSANTKPAAQVKRIYITDIKTRQKTSSLPSGSGIRPTLLQLHLYHHLLENLAQGNFPVESLAERYDFDIEEPFSDSFIAQVGSLNQSDLGDEFSNTIDQIQENGLPSSQDSIDTLLRHNTVSKLWGLMMSQFHRTFMLDMSSISQQSFRATPQSEQQSLHNSPLPQSQRPTQLSPILTAEYLSPEYKHIPGTARRSLGKKSFIFSSTFLKDYLEDTLGWWHGQRKARGVELQEAWKCRSCDFRDECVWIHERDQAVFDEAIMKRKMRQIAGVDGNGDAVHTGGSSGVDSAAAAKPVVTVNPEK